MKKNQRTANYENKEAALKNNATFSMEEIEDVCRLIVNEEWPDGRFSDNECCLWSMIKKTLKIDY